jgi:hypothetical protein
VLAEASVGVAGGVTAEDAMTGVLACSRELAVASAAIDGSSMGAMRWLANDALGAGPIAAPTAAPMASMLAANAALTRNEGRHGRRAEVSGGAVIGSGDWAAYAPCS